MNTKQALAAAFLATLAAFHIGAVWGADRWAERNSNAHCDAVVRETTDFAGEWREFERLEDGRWCVTARGE